MHGAGKEDAPSRYAGFHNQMAQDLVYDFCSNRHTGVFAASPRGFPEIVERGARKNSWRIASRGE